MHGSRNFRWLVGVGSGGGGGESGSAEKKNLSQRILFISVYSFLFKYSTYFTVILRGYFKENCHA